MNGPALQTWLMARAKEPSTLRGIIGLGMSLGIGINPDILSAILTIGISLISLVNIVKRDAGSRDAKPRAR